MIMTMRIIIIVIQIMIIIIIIIVMIDTRFATWNLIISLLTLNKRERVRDR